MKKGLSLFLIFAAGLLVGWSAGRYLAPHYQVSVIRGGGLLWYDTRSGHTYVRGSDDVLPLSGDTILNSAPK